MAQPPVHGLARPMLGHYGGGETGIRISGVSDDNRNNTIAGWVLGAGIAALGVTILADKASRSHAPEKPGFAIVGEATESDAPAGPPLETLLASADLAKGEATFAKCAACHTIEQGGANGIGPNLWATMGAKHGHIAGFAYSEALTSIAGPWDWKGMDAWLANPRRYAPGTKMSFAGLSDPVERANLIAWLNTKGSNLPLPPVPAAEAAPADGAAPADAAGAPADAAAPPTDAAAAPAAPAQ
jgi:cytochrome c